MEGRCHAPAYRRVAHPQAYFLTVIFTLPLAGAIVLLPAYASASVCFPGLSLSLLSGSTALPLLLALSLIFAMVFLPSLTTMTPVGLGTPGTARVTVSLPFLTTPCTVAGAFGTVIAGLL